MQGNVYNWTIAICTIVTIIINIGFEIYRNNRDKAWKEEIEKKEKESDAKIDRINCSTDFAKVMMKKEIFAETLAEAGDLEEIDKVKMSDAEVKSIQKSNDKVIRRIYIKAISFYNELDEFCSKVVEGTYIAEDYIKNDVSVSILDFVKMQPQYYNNIRQLYKTYNVAGYTPFKRHRLKNIDKFMDRYLQHHKTSINKAWKDNKL